MRTRLLGSVLFALILITFEGRAAASNAQGPYSVEVVVDGQPQPVFMSNGRAYVAGIFGAAYQLRVRNHSGRRIEAVVAVDGRDVLTGQPVDPRRHRGHIVPAYGTTSIAGFRSSSSSVATFRFSTIPRSYAWRTGTAWGIGTIRVWVFEEAVPEPVVELPHPVVPRRNRSHPRRSRAQGAPSGAEAAAPSAPRDMGTEYGEQRWSPVRHTRFQRRRRGATATLGIRYQSHEALAAAGILHPVWHDAVVYEVDDPPFYCVGCRWPGAYPYAAPPPGYPY